VATNGRSNGDLFPPVRVVSGPAFELIAQLSAFTSGPARGSLEAGKTWIREVRELAGPELIRGVERWALPQYSELASLAYEAGPPYAIDQLVRRIRAARPAALMRRLVGADSGHNRAMLPDGAFDRALAGDATARAHVLDMLGVNASARQSTERLLLTRPEFVQAEIAALVETWASRVFPAYREASMALIERDVAAKEHRFAKVPGREAVRIATNGVEFDSMGLTTEIVVVPTVALRPFIAAGEFNSTSIILCSVADEAFVEDPAAPPRRLVQVATALGDATRLRILHELDEGDLTAYELAERIDFDRTSLHHHLGILRSAGLVTARAEGVQAWRYSVRADGITGAAEGLAGYLHPARSDD
jgi:DNA-binding transcriptional ArsR family regulator